MNTGTPLDKHEKVVFHFSGGKDSIACLIKLFPYRDRITLIWGNTGESFPETLAQMEMVKQLWPNFIEVKTDVRADHLQRGFPVDVLPLKNDVVVQYYLQAPEIPLQSFLSCCMNNLMAPVLQASKDVGATLIIRGQKERDKHKSPVKSGEVHEGFEFWFPIEDWTDADVRELVQNSALLPAHYSEANTSLDCWSCTAFLADNQWKLPYLKKHHPEKAIVVQERLRFIRKELISELQLLEVCNGD